ncbi:MAG: CHAT domain-containing protein [Candidatus Omnitrophica bacterium]|nr:CHAT domain-containing protein [Candidatus Omnitrophota bacterium]
MPEDSILVLEVIRQPDLLKMSLFEQAEATSTLKHYSQQKVDFREIERLCQEVTQILNKANFQDAHAVKSLQKTAQALWDHLLTRPVKEKLKSSLSLSLILSIDEELINIPWELLYDGTNFLGLRFSLGRLVKTKAQGPDLKYRSPSHISKMLILANPTNDLKAAYLEGLNIKNQFDHRSKSVRIDFKSTNIDRLYLKKNLCDYDIVHFAGHCEYEPANQKNSGWVLSDGKFTVQDILSMGQTVSLPALIFSNACHSAKSNKAIVDADYQKKNYSLAAAFLFSGVRHYIGSIRRIEDSASLSFAKEFYHYLILGRSVGESMRLARLRLVKEYGIISMHWANYLLYGDPSYILFKPKVKLSRGKPRINKRIIGFSLALLALVTICICLYIWLPSINPSTYFLFAKSQKLFNKGNNQQTVALGNRIITQDRLFLGIYPLLADAYYRLGDKESALKTYFDYALLAEKRQDKKHITFAYIQIGWLYHLDAEYQKALDFYNKAIELARKNNDKLNEAIAMRKLAVWNIDKQNYALALELLTKSSEINRQRQYLYDHRYNLACDYFDIGLVFANKNDYAAAAEFYRKSRLAFEKLKLKNELSDYYFNLGELYVFEKQYQKALDCYLSGLKIDEFQANKASLASDYNMIGELYVDMDNFSQAEKSFNQAIEVSSQIKSRTDLAEAYRNLGSLYKRLGKKNKAKEYLRLAQEIYGIIDPLSYPGDLRNN